MPGTAVKFKDPYSGNSPDTLYQVDPATKTLSPFGSGSAYTEAGFQFGQEKLANPADFAGFSVGPIINDRAASLASVKSDLNNFQNDQFNADPATNKRKSSTLEESINADQQTYDDAAKEYSGLKDKLAAIAAPNYEQAYNEARTKAGVPALESQFVDNSAARRELPYVNRVNTGNAGVATEGQLGADTAQKDIPLGIKEANLIDRLQLASDFVNNSLKFKQMDSDQARQSITEAATLLGNTIQMTRQHLTDLQGTQDKQQARADAQAKDAQNRQDQALDFAIKNNINTPVFVVGTQGYDARTLEPISLEQYQKLTGQQVGLPEKNTSFSPSLVTKIDGGKQEEQGLVLDLIKSYPDAAISPNDSFVVASSKLKNSRIYQEKVRPPKGSAADDKVSLTDGTNLADQYLSSKRGGDGFVNPKDFQAARDAWISDGLDVNSFYDRFKKYVNPADPQDY